MLQSDGRANHTRALAAQCLEHTRHETLLAALNEPVEDLLSNEPIERVLQPMRKYALLEISVFFHDFLACLARSSHGRRADVRLAQRQSLTPEVSDDTLHDLTFFGSKPHDLELLEVYLEHLMLVELVGRRVRHGSVARPIRVHAQRLPRLGKKPEPAHATMLFSGIAETPHMARGRVAQDLEEEDLTVARVKLGGY